MRRALFPIAIVLAASAPAWAQQPTVSYSVTIDSPGSVAVGEVTLRVRVSGGVQEPEAAAYHLRTSGAWSQGQSLRLSRTGEGTFEGSIDTVAIPNDAYRIEARVWSDVPPYDPGDPRTFARATLDLAVDNPPATPQGVEALTPATSLRVGWRAVDTAEREDFAGYRILLHRGRSCPPDISAYRTYEQPDGVFFTQEKVAPGDYCVRVASARASEVTGAVLSPPSAPVRISIEKGNDPIIQGDGIVIETNEEAVPPPPPVLGDADPIISDGEFVEDLPYGSQTITQEAEQADDGEPVSLEAGHDPKRTPVLIAAGMILATFAGLIRRFLSGVAKA